MLDIKWIRENPEVLDNNQINRGGEKISSELLALDAELRKTQNLLQSLQQDRNGYSKSLASVAKNSDEFNEIKNKVVEINDQIKNLKEKEDETSLKLNNILNNIPNILASDVPLGKGEEDNKEIAVYGDIKEFSFEPKPHYELGENLGMMDFEQTAKISGSRFVTLKRDLVKLERAIANFMIDLHVKEFGFEEMSPPLLVKSNAMFGTGQLPKFAEDSFCTTDEKWLISTSEISLTNMAADKITMGDELPLRMTAYTPCFRSEAGSAGKDTRGMIRLHQFSKVELVTICKQEDNELEYSNLLAAAKEVLNRLQLPYREMLLCSADIGFSAKKTIDLEVWLPSQNCYREISSCSYFEDFQARRMKARYKENFNDKETKFVYTMNGSGLAVGRTLLAILENYQQEDGSIVVPDVLQDYMGNQQVICKGDM